jgi:ribosomal protein S18 acetylase RimI-like enzyme
MRIRAARIQDAEAAAALLIELPGGLEALFRTREEAANVGTAMFVGRRTVLSHRFSLIAEDRGEVIGVMARLPGRMWRRLRITSGLAMIRAAGLLQAPRVVLRGRVQDRLISAVPADVLYVPALVVVPDRRRQGIGTSLLLRAIGEAADLELRAAALDVAADNRPAIDMYTREGFNKVSERVATPTRGKPRLASLRMELSLGPRG